MLETEFYVQEERKVIRNQFQITMENFTQWMKAMFCNGSTRGGGRVEKTGTGRQVATRQIVKQ